MSLGGVESVVYRKALLELIDQRTAAVNNITLGLGILISLSAILLVSNTIRLAIYAKRRLIRTMELVGATSTFIRLPFLIEGLIQGVLGGLIASALLYGALEHLIRWISAELSAFIHMEAAFYVLVIAGGTVLGLLGSIISVVRFIHTPR
jgi:cell division transport system permease protein